MSDIPKSIVAPRIRAAIKQSGRTQKEIAAAMEISEQYLSDIATGRRSVSAYVAVRLEAVLGIDSHKIMVDQALYELRCAREEFKVTA